MAARRFAARLVPPLLLLGLTPAAEAQVSASLSATTDVRNRGLSLNGGRPALSASVAWDGASGLYAGATVTGGATRRYGVQYLGHSEYIGYAARLNPVLAWEVGVSNTQIESNVLRRFSGHYTEAYAGLSSERFSARVHVSPDYIVANLATLYFDLNANLRLARNLRTFGHAGLLMRIGGDGGGVLPRSRTDLRAGVAAAFDGGEVQLAYVRSGARDAYLAPRAQSRDALTLGATLFF